MDEKKYGFYGWQEFENNRTEILTEYDRSKNYNNNRPTKVEHGNAGEAAIRAWLEKFIPAKYGVTSGYIIPDILADEYKIYEFDVIIFDKLNAPILWIDANKDTSEQGRKKAIPAKYVYAVFEVKSQFTHTSIKKSIEKLETLNGFRAYLSKNFSCAIIFFELQKNLVDQTQLLKNLLPKKEIFGYYGGIILRCELNLEMSGILELVNTPTGEIVANCDVPLAKNIDDLPIYRDDEERITVAGQGVGGTSFFIDGKYHVSKNYGPIVFDKNFGIDLRWSYNSFASFCIRILSLLEGMPLNAPKMNYVFGQVFDKLTYKSKNTLDQEKDIN